MLHICGKNFITLPSVCEGVGRFIGVENATIEQGDDFDLAEGVTALDGDGYAIPFTITPSDINTCEVGTFTFTYEAESLTATRKITITSVGNPVISGASSALSVAVGEEFDPLDGVSAVDAKGNILTVTVSLLS